MTRRTPEPVDLAQVALGLSARSIDVLRKGLSTPRIEGFTLGLWETAKPAPHGGEMHPDGDEFLLVIEGSVDIAFDEDGQQGTLHVGPGGACVVPRGLWHRVLPNGPCKILHITPGPSIELRPAQS